MVDAQKMDDRGDATTEACRTHLGPQAVLDIRQTRKGCLQECLGCEAATEFKFLTSTGSGDGSGTHFATALEESNCCLRIFCTGIHPFKMSVNEINTNAELFTVDRPCACPAGGCKCCCYQSATITSQNKLVGQITETCYYCVPSFDVTDKNGNKIYLIHPPTCCGGMCVNICAEGNPCCGRGCCKVPFWIYDANQTNTNGDVDHAGKILKQMKSFKTELFTDADAFEVTFPEGATVEQKAILAGSTIFINALYFEGQNNGEV